MQKLQPQTEILVDNEKYIVQLYSPTFGFTLYAKLLAVLGEPLLKFMETFKGRGFTAKSVREINFDDIKMESVGEALQTLFTRLPPDQFVPLLQEILSSTFITPTLNPVVSEFETRFQGRYMHVFKLAAKTLGVQYPDFLSGLGKRLNAVSGAPASETPKGKTRGA